MDFEKYAFAFEEDRDPPWAMDREHVAMLHALAMQVPDGGTVVEIGSHRGASTSAFVEALNKGKEFDLWCVELDPRQDLWAVCDLCTKRDDIHVCVADSTDFEIPKQADLVFIDGDHGVQALVDVYHAIEAEARVIAMHDTRSHEHGIRGCLGAWLAAKMLSQVPERVWDEDCPVVDGRWTHRGFGWSRNGPDVGRAGNPQPKQD